MNITFKYNNKSVANKGYQANYVLRRVSGFSLRLFSRRNPNPDRLAGYPADTSTMPGNNAPAAYQQQGDVLNAFARDQNAPNADFAALLDEYYLRALNRRREKGSR